MANKKVLTSSIEAFKTEDIRTIIKTCRAEGVARLKWGELEVEFTQPSGAVSLGLTENAAYQNHSPKPALQDGKASSDRFNLVDKQILEDIQRSQLMLDDPVGFEDQMINEQIESSRVASVNARGNG